VEQAVDQWPELLLSVRQPEQEVGGAEPRPPGGPRTGAFVFNHILFYNYKYIF
jgi:hypothetical protein